MFVRAGAVAEEVDEVALAVAQQFAGVVECV